MKAISNVNGEEIKRGDLVRIHKLSNGYWGFTGKHGSFEEVTESGFINFNFEGKPRQCMPQGIGAIVK